MNEYDKMILIMEYSSKILELIDNPPEVSRGDLQGIAEAIIMRTILDVEKTKELTQ